MSKTLLLIRLLPALAAGACTNASTPEQKAPERAASAPEARGDVESQPSLDESPAVEPSGNGLRKGLGGTNGDPDYCDNPNAKCAATEGDCDSTAQCVAGVGLTCATDNGARFGFSQDLDVCVPSTCLDRVTNNGEDPMLGPDCGGSSSCGACNPACNLANGDPNRCSYHCQCPGGVGDCDANDHCRTGLRCVADIGARFTMAADLDVCVPAQCTNRVQDPNEERIDCGGTSGCGACVCPGSNGDGSFCTPSCQCALGSGDCDTNLDCQPGLVCGTDNGGTFGLAATTDTCVPQHCTNHVLDAGELGIDCGGTCGGTCIRVQAGLAGGAVQGESGGVKVHGALNWQGRVRGEANGIKLEGGFR